MDINTILIAVLIVAGIVALVALALLLLELKKTVAVAKDTVVDLQQKMDPILVDAQDLTTSLKPVMAKADPLVDRVTLTVDSLNLEMMRLDQILEDVTDITDAASSATKAAENISTAPVKLASNVATKMKGAFGGKDASDEAAMLAEQRVAVAQALEDYKAAEAKEAKKAVQEVAEDKPVVGAHVAAEETQPLPAFTEEPVIDRDAIATSPFFTEDINEQ